MRAITSTGPPGGNGTTIWIARSGKAAEPACPQTPSMTTSRQSRTSALISHLPDRRPVSRRAGAGATAASKGKGIEATVGADIEPIAGGQQSLEVAQSGHCIAWTAAAE